VTHAALLTAATAGEHETNASIAPCVQIARQMGADIGILSGRTESPYAVGDRIKSVLGPDGPSVVIDCAGFEATMQVRCWCSATPVPVLWTQCPPVPSVGLNDVFL
jgi:threonine dehydrogenase-like Zn-dependent dehydrogenase